jgi:colicin import membrane protein
MIADSVYRTRLRTHADRKLISLMLVCSLILHGVVVIFATAKWRLTFGKPRLAPVYSVELVTLPAPRTKKYPAVDTGRRTRTVAPKQAIAIPRFRTKEQALTLKKKNRSSAPNNEAEDVKFAKEVLTKIERRPSPQPKVSKKPADVPRQSAPSKQKVSLVNIGGMKGGELSQALMLYRALVNEKIESNWVLPERLSRETEDLEAVVVVRARRDGTVFDINFEKKSGNSYFDDSVLKAILKSKPFPPFPDIYSPQEEEIVIRFAPENVRS